MNAKNWNEESTDNILVDAHYLLSDTLLGMEVMIKEKSDIDWIRCQQVMDSDFHIVQSILTLLTKMKKKV